MNVLDDFFLLMSVNLSIDINVMNINLN